MEPAPVGTKIRIIANSNDHHYRIGEIYTIAHIAPDGTFRAKDSDGTVGDWLQWSDCVPAAPIGWEFLQRSLPAEVVDFLSAFDGLEKLQLKVEIIEHILQSLPAAREGAPPPAPRKRQRRRGRQSSPDAREDAASGEREPAGGALAPDARERAVLALPDLRERIQRAVAARQPPQIP